MVAVSRLGSGMPEAVTWDAISAHIEQRLKMDPEWVLKNEDELIWFSWFLQQRIWVADRGLYPDGDNWLRICSEVQICEIGEDSGIALASQWNALYQIGVFEYEDGWMFMRTSFTCNPLNLNLLSFLHQNLLIANSLAHQFAVEFAHDDRAKVYAFEHPVSGQREEADELIQIYFGPSIGPILPEGYSAPLEMIRAELETIFGDLGYEKGFESGEVIHFYNSNFTFGIGQVEDSEQFIKFGPGLRVIAYLTAGMPKFDDASVNEFHLMMHNTDGAGLAYVGPMVAVPLEANPEIRSSLMFYLDGATLAEARLDIRALASVVANACLNASSALSFLNFLQEDAAAQTATGKADD